MGLTEKFLSFTLLGAEWVMWVLIALSVLSVGIMIERAICFVQRWVSYDRIAFDTRRALVARTPEVLHKQWGMSQSIEAQVALAGVREAHRGPGAAAEAMVGAKIRHRQQLERNLAILGTLGNNAPFIGLFGTVLGIIKAFHDLSRNSQQGAEAVMKGISEALVATAIGLLVAIPAVIAFNIFQRLLRRAVVNGDAIAHDVLTELRTDEEARAGKKEAA